METQAHLNHMAAVNVSFNDDSVEHYETAVIYTACMLQHKLKIQQRNLQSADNW